MKQVQITNREKIWIIIKKECQVLRLINKNMIFFDLKFSLVPNPGIQPER